MSSIIAYRDKEKDRVIVGYDSAQVTRDGEMDSNAIVEKVFKHDKLDILFGITGPASVNFMLRTLSFGRNLKGVPVLPGDISIRFITSILEIMKKSAKDSGFTYQFKSSSILIVVKNRIFTITNGSVVTEYDSAVGIGCGHSVYTFKTIKHLSIEIKPEIKVLTALRVLAECNVNVYAPFYLTETETYSVEKFDK